MIVFSFGYSDSSFISRISACCLHMSYMYICMFIEITRHQLMTIDHIPKPTICSSTVGTVGNLRAACPLEIIRGPTSEGEG